MKLRSFLYTLTLVSFSSLFTSCSSSAPQGQLADLPEICRHYDFANDPEMAETCGIRQTRYKSYKNIPPQRYLINPKGTTVALKEQGVELRLPNTMPVELDPELKNKIDFSEDSKSVMLKNKYEYKELFPKQGERLRLFKLSLPLNQGGVQDFCFSIPKPVVDERRKSAVGHTVLSIGCEEYARLIQSN